jgi:type I protein arginine methyltransferase
MAKPIKYTIDFTTAIESDLYTIDIPLKFDVQAASIIHGLAFWFDVVFAGTVYASFLSFFF